MTTITINVEDDVEAQFRRHAAELYKSRKGFLGDAITDAMSIWLSQKKQTEIAEEALQLLRKGFNMGKLLYKKRAELHER